MATSTTKKVVAKKTPAKTAVKKVVAPKKAAPKSAAAKEAKTMPSLLEAQVFTMAGKEAGTVALPPELFAVAWNSDLVHQVVVGMQANARPTVAHTKFRGEVSGGGKKPWKQKGTGRARHGSSRSPIWKGGGVTHGPRAEKDYSVKINKKMRLAAFATVLSRKYRDGEVVFVDTLTFSAPKTKDAILALGALAKVTGKGELVTKRKNAGVIALASKNTNTEKSFSNIGSYITQEVRNLNPLDLLNKKFVVIERPTESLAVLASRFNKAA